MRPRTPFHERDENAGWLIVLIAIALLVLITLTLDRSTHSGVALSSLILYAGYIALASTLLLHRRRHAKRIENAQWALCPTCGYDLRTLPQRGACPECGRTYSRDAVRRFWINKYSDPGT
ncbi:MAG: hypothetical protein HRU70_09080 [Phycisphaeraceae bacterium]|nr:MAG: hypothetical protein HRU70_09080 [Phycisphaeraceae bacterium]